MSLGMMMSLCHTRQFPAYGGNHYRPGRVRSDHLSSPGHASAVLAESGHSGEVAGARLAQQTGPSGRLPLSGHYLQRDVFRRALGIGITNLRLCHQLRAYPPVPQSGPLTVLSVRKYC